MTKRGTGAFSHARTVVGRPRHLALVFVGGVAGTAARWLVTSAVPQSSLAWGTLLVDLSGSFLLGLLLEVLGRRAADIAGHVGWRLLLGTGFCGAFTTYSSMAVESSRLLQQGRPALAAGWAMVTVVGGVLCAGSGVMLGVGLDRRRE